jgi:hypothetical protein
LTDATDGAFAVGANAWALSSGATSGLAQSVNPGIFADARSWQVCTDNVAVTDTTVIRSFDILPNDGNAYYLYLHARDKLGNESTSNVGIAERYLMDNTAPTVNSLTLTSNSSSFSTRSTAVDMTVNVTDAGSGINKLVFSGDVSIADVASTIVSGYACSISGNTVTFSPAASGGSCPGGTVSLTLSGTITGSDGTKTINVLAGDFVGNTSDADAGTAGNQPKASSIIFDKTSPVNASAAKVNGGSTGMGIPVYDAGSGAGLVCMTLNLTEENSGVKTIEFAGDAYVGSGSLAGIKVYMGGTLTVSSGIANVSGGTKLAAGTDYSVSGNTITFTEAALENTRNPGGTLVLNINGIGLNGALSGATLTASVTDRALNPSLDATVTGLNRDSIPPILTSVTLTPAVGSLGNYSISSSVKATLSYKEETSGVAAFAIIGANTTNAHITGYADGDLDRTSNGIIKIISGTYPKSASGTIEITNLELPSQGDNVVTVKLTDGSSNDSGVVTATPNPIFLDTVLPPAPSLTPSAALSAAITAGTAYSTGNTYYTGPSYTDIALTPSNNITFSWIGTEAASATTSGTLEYYRNTVNTAYGSTSANPSVITPSATMTEYFFWSKDNAGNYTALNSSSSVKVLYDNVLPAYPTASPVTDSTIYDTGTQYDCKNAITVNLSGGGETVGNTNSGFDVYGCGPNASSIVWYGSSGTNITWVDSDTVTLTAVDTATTYYFFSRDKVGNVSALSESSKIKIQKDAYAPSISSITGPSVTISPTAGYYFESGKWYTNADSFTATLVCVDPDSGGVSSGLATTGGYALAGSYQDGTSFSINLASEGEGEHTYSFTCKDRCGNVSTPVLLTIVVDKTGPAAPTVTFDATGLYNKPSTNSWYSASAAGVTLTPADTADPDSGSVAGAGFYQKGWSTDGTSGSATWNIAAKAVTLSTTAANLTFFCRDKVGNVSAASTTYTFVRDTGNPAVNLTSLVAKAVGKSIYHGASNTIFYYDGTATWGQSDADSGLKEYAISTSATAPATAGEWTAGTAASGTLDLPAVTGTASALYLYVRDQVGNVQKVDLASAYNTTYGTSGYTKWLQDQTPPDASAMTFGITGTNFLSGSTYYYDFDAIPAGLTVTPSCADGAGGAGGVKYYLSGSPGSTFPNTSLTGSSGTGTEYEFYAVDGVGNASSSGKSIFIAQDTGVTSAAASDFACTAGYSIVAVAGSPDTLYYNNVTFKITASDTGCGLKSYAVSKLSATDAAYTLSSGASISVPYVPVPVITSASPVYLYVKDNLDHVYTIDLATAQGHAGYSWLQDTTGPDLSALTFTPACTSGPSANYFASGSTYYYNFSSSTSLTLKPDTASVSDASGIIKYSLASDGLLPFAAADGTQLEGSAGAGATYNFYAIDGVGNVTAGANKKSVTVVQETMAPSIPAFGSVGAPSVTSTATYALSETSDTVYLYGGTVAFTPSDAGSVVGGKWFIDTTATYADSTAFNTAYGSKTTTWDTSGTAITGEALPVTSSAMKYYVHVMDKVGLIGDQQICYTDTSDQWVLDQTPPSAATVTASGTAAGFYYKVNDAASATFYYKTVGTTGTVGTLTGGTDTGSSGITFSETSGGSYTASLAPAAYTVAVGGTHTYWLKDAVGNKREVTITDTADLAPTFGAVSFPGGHKEIGCVATDPEGGLVAYTVHSTSDETNPTTASNYTVTNTVSTKTYTWTYDYAKVTLTDNGLYIPDFYGTSADHDFYVRLTATDRVGWVTTRYIKVHYDTSSSNQTAAVDPAYPDGSLSIMLLGGANLPRTRGTVTIATPIEHAAAISGSGLIDWEPEANTAMYVNRSRIAELNKKLSDAGSSAGFANLQPLHNVKNDVTEVKFAGTAASSTISGRHAAILARLRGENGSVQTRSEQNVSGSGKNTEKRPEIQNDIKQDDSFGVVGVYLNHDAGRLFSIMEPLAAAYLESKGISL